MNWTSLDDYADDLEDLAEDLGYSSYADAVTELATKFGASPEDIEQLITSDPAPLSCLEDMTDTDPGDPAYNPNV